jgi:hypothetical protein
MSNFHLVLEVNGDRRGICVKAESFGDHEHTALAAVRTCDCATVRVNRWKGEAQK